LVGRLGEGPRNAPQAAVQAGLGIISVVAKANQPWMPINAWQSTNNFVSC